jgi:hypothetical protein
MFRSDIFRILSLAMNSAARNLWKTGSSEPELAMKRQKSLRTGVTFSKQTPLRSFYSHPNTAGRNRKKSARCGSGKRRSQRGAGTTLLQNYGR